MINADLIEKLRALDEVTLIELLDLSSEDIVDAFLDKIDERMSYIYSQLNDQN